MLKTARIYKSDIAEIKSIHDKLNFQWYEPSLHIGTIAIRDDEDKLLGAGHLRPMVEAVMILDPDLPKKVRARCLLAMLSQAVHDAENSGYDELYAWINNDPLYCDILRKHYCWESMPGTSLRLRFNHGRRGEERSSEKGI